MSTVEDSKMEDMAIDFANIYAEQTGLGASWELIGVEPQNYYVFPDEKVRAVENDRGTSSWASIKGAGSNGYSTNVAFALKSVSQSGKPTRLLFPYHLTSSGRSITVQPALLVDLTSFRRASDGVYEFSASEDIGMFIVHSRADISESDRQEIYDLRETIPDIETILQNADHTVLTETIRTWCELKRHVIDLPLR